MDLYQKDRTQLFISLGVNSDPEFYCKSVLNSVSHTSVLHVDSAAQNKLVHFAVNFVSKRASIVSYASYE